MERFLGISFLFTLRRILRCCSDCWEMYLAYIQRNTNGQRLTHAQVCQKRNICHIRMLLACVHASHILSITLYTYWRRTQISHCIYIILYSLYSHHSTKQVRPNFIWYHIIWTFIYVSICWECRNWNPNFLVSLSLSFLLDTQGILNYIIVIGYFRFSMF